MKLWNHKGVRSLILFLLLMGVITLGAVPREVKGKDEVIRTVDTMDSRVHLSGKASPGTVFAVSVYTFRQEEEKRVFFRVEQTVSESGFYDIVLPLPVLGEQFVSIEENGLETVILYRRFSKDLPLEMEEFYLNVYDAVTK